MPGSQRCQGSGLRHHLGIHVAHPLFDECAMQKHGIRNLVKLAGYIVSSLRKGYESSA